MTIKDLYNAIKQHVNEHPDSEIEILVETPESTYDVYEIENIDFNEIENVLEIKTNLQNEEQ